MSCYAVMLGIAQVDSLNSSVFDSNASRIWYFASQNHNIISYYSMESKSTQWFASTNLWNSRRGGCCHLTVLTWRKTKSWRHCSKPLIDKIENAIASA